MRIVTIRAPRWSRALGLLAFFAIAATLPLRSQARPGAEPAAAAEADLQVVQLEADLQVVQADAATFLVVRRAAKGPAVEGFVVDRDALLESLRTRVLEEQGLGALARVTAARRNGADPGWLRDSASNRYPPPMREAYSFTHRFGAPFDQLDARLDLAPLSGDEGAGAWLYPLALGLALAVIVGLLALYRMVAVQVRYAQQRSNFVSAVSHELKTPLTAIRMYGEMLRDDLVESEDKRRSYYRIISAETERLSRLINNVLELSRLERRERTMDMHVGDLSDAVQEAIRLFAPHAEREGVSLRWVTEPDLPAVRFDRDAVKQVLFNLLDNALKYGRGGAERIVEVRCEAMLPHVRLCVRDTGPGVAAPQLRAIFEPFYRAQDELTRKQQGTGIGLALVKNLVERMDGQVVGKNLAPGFEVSVSLPVATDG